MDFSILGSLSAPGALKSGADAGKTSGQEAQQAFSNLVENALDNVVETQKTAENLSIAAAQGENVPMHQVIQAVSEAQMTLETMVSVRDKAVEAYQEIVRMAI